MRRKQEECLVLLCSPLYLVHVPFLLPSRMFCALRLSPHVKVSISCCRGDVEISPFSYLQNYFRFQHFLVSRARSSHLPPNASAEAPLRNYGQITEHPGNEATEQQRRKRTICLRRSWHCQGLIRRSWERYEECVKECAGWELLISMFIICVNENII